MKKNIFTIFAIALSLSVFAQQQRDTMFVHTTDRFIHEFATHDIDSIVFYRTQDRMEFPPRDTVRDTIIVIERDTIIIRDTVRDTIVKVVYLIVTSQDLMFYNEASLGGINITSNTDWTITSSQPWVTLSQETGANSEIVTVYIDENTSGLTRQATLTVTAFGAPNRTVSVEQRYYTEPVLILRETFGVPASNTLIANYSGWTKTGMGASNVTYSGTGNVDVRITAVSPNPPFSGGGNVFFPTNEPAGQRTFTISGIDPGSATIFELSFATQGTSTNLIVEYSIDGTTWIGLSFIKSTTSWGLVEICFEIPEPTTNLRLRFRVPTGTTGNFRIDDVELNRRRSALGGCPVLGVPFRLELPLVRDTTWFIQHRADGIVNFSLEYDTAQRHAFWIAYVLTSELLTINTERQNNFTFDPKIPREFQPHAIGTSGQIVIPSFWRDYGYERGHIMASRDRRFSQVANSQSNFMSNISPHLPEFHNSHGGTGSGDGVWLRLEHRVRYWAEMPGVDTLYVVKGGAIVPGAPGTNIVEVLYSINRVVVPQHYFKAIVKRMGNSFYGIAFWLEQYRGMARRPARRTDAITIRELEYWTGIDFFPNLRIYGEQIGQPDLEDAVENTPINWSRWPGIN